MGKIGTIFVGVLIFMLGWASTMAWIEFSNQRVIDGLWVPGALDDSDAENIASEYDAAGHWVCINTNGMSYKRMVEVCQHEAGHEIWARACERDDAMCEEAQELLDDYTK